MDPFWQKLIWTGVGIACVVLGAVWAPASKYLNPLGIAIIGATWGPVVGVGGEPALTP